MAVAIADVIIAIINANSGGENELGTMKVTNLTTKSTHTKLCAKVRK